MTISVQDARSNANEQIVHAAKVIGRSKRRKKVFEAIYRGKKAIKLIAEIEKDTGLGNIAVLQEGKKLASNYIVEQTKTKEGTGYKKDKFYSQYYRKILAIAGNSDKIAKIPTKRNAQATIRVIKQHVLDKLVKIEQTTIDDIDNFQQVKTIQEQITKIKPMYEKAFKEGVKKIIGERGKFTDWGGERNDLFSTKIKISGKRRPCAFAFKGKGTKGVLTPKKMGKNGDQIQRLFNSPAEAFLIQYWGAIDESIIEQMKAFALAKSVLEQKKIYFGIIDGSDSQRLIQSYAKYFST